MKLHKLNYGLITILGLAVGNLACAGASWGSIHANNRSESRGGAFRNDNRSESRGGAFRTAPVNPGSIVGRRPEEHVERERVQPEDRERQERVERDVNRREEWRDRRHLDIEEDRRHAFFWGDYNPGMVIGVLPPAYSQVYVGSVPYFYDQGVFYQSAPSGYVVVNPPLGAVVAQLPPGAEAIPVGSTVYYYAGGAFYLPQAQGFVVVAPPLGITVPDLPPGAVPVNINGMVYYQSNGVDFMPVMQNGVTVYVTVQPPG